MTNNPRQSIPNTTGSNGYTNNYYTDVGTNVGRQNRSRNLPAGAEASRSSAMTASFAPTNDSVPDWRVKVKVPSLSTYRTSPILKPLGTTDWFAVFPVTPTISLVTSANYDTMTPTHSNYPFPQYVNSETQEITVTGVFPVQSEKDGLYWLACVHLFRSLTKMFYGEGSEKGSPPPVVKLSGYGDYVLNDIPTVVTQFSFDLANEVDYLKVNTSASGSSASNYQMVPVTTTMSVTLKPTYSRSKISSFKMEDFISGKISDKGFI